MDLRITEKTLSIKLESGCVDDSTDVQNLQNSGEVWIKQEPSDADESQGSLEDIPAYPVHVESVKVEPFIFESGDENENERVQAVSVRTKKSSGSDCDEEYVPQKEKNGSKSDKNNGKSAANTTERDQKLDYSEDVMKLIKIYTLTEEERLQEHRDAMEARKHMEHMCKYCALGFVLEDAYSVHMKIHQPEFGEYECELCHAWHKSTQSLHQHRLRHYRRYRCTACGTRYRDKDSAASHAMRAHAGRVFPCEHCHRGFKRPRYLKRHVEQYHNRTQSIECPVCKRIFYEKDMFRCHMRSHNKEARAKQKRPSSCPVCSREYKSRASMKKHLLSHERNVPCDLCEEICQDRLVLRKHYHRAHNQLYINNSKEETCPYCFRVCVTGPMLKRHIERMHSDRTKKYQCEHCQRLFMTKGEVRSHIVWSHLPASIRGGHLCRCGRLFRTPSLLADHVNRRHRGQRPPRDHRCPCCGKGFMDKQVLNRHMKVHSKEMYPCQECGLEFKTKPYVEVHYKLRHLNMTRAEIKTEKMLNGRRIRNNTNIKSVGNIGSNEVNRMRLPKVKSSRNNDSNEPSGGNIKGFNSESSDGDPLIVQNVKVEPADEDLPFYPLRTPSEVH